jgi:hypothetical protein
LLIAVVAAVVLSTDRPDEKVTTGPARPDPPADIKCPETGQDPPARFDAAMASDRDGLLVFGGNDGRTYVGETWASTCGHWTRLSPSSSPPADGRSLAAFDTEAAEVRLVAGDGSVWAWKGDDWRMLSSGGLPRLADPHMVYDTVGERLLLVGANGAALETWAWDGATWARLGSTDGLGRLRHYGLAHHVGVGKTLLVGGVTDGDMLAGTTYVWERSRWVATEEPDGPQGAVIAAYDEQARAIVAVDDLDSRTWLWDGTWKLTSAPGPGRRFDAAAAFDPSTKGVVLFGGQSIAAASSSAPRPANDTWRWDKDRWVEARAG